MSLYTYKAIANFRFGHHIWILISTQLHAPLPASWAQHASVPHKIHEMPAVSSESLNLLTSQVTKINLLSSCVFVSLYVMITVQCFASQVGNNTVQQHMLMYMCTVILCMHTYS